jgi:hypothetical protein
MLNMLRGRKSRERDAKPEALEKKIMTMLGKSRVVEKGLREGKPVQ